MEQGIVFVLINNAAVIAIVKPDDTKPAKVYPMVIPQKIKVPAITYQRVTTEPSNVKDGPSTLDVNQIDIDSWADTYDEAKDLAAAVRAALDRLPDATYNGDILQSIAFDNQVDDFSEIPDQPRFHITQTYNVRFRR